MTSTSRTIRGAKLHIEKEGQILWKHLLPPDNGDMSMHGWETHHRKMIRMYQERGWDVRLVPYLWGGSLE